MKYVKMLALAAVAAGALMAFIGAGTASASKLCSTTTDPCTSPWASPSTLDFSIAAGGTAVLKEPGAGGAILDTCTTSTVKGTVTNGTATVTANGPVTAANLTWAGCTQTTKTTAGGTLEVHKIAGTSNGTVTGSGFKVTVLVFGFIDCEYEVGENADIGNITEGKPGIFHAEAITVKTKGVGCPEKGEWSATYTQTEPANTTLSVSAS